MTLAAKMIDLTLKDDTVLSLTCSSIIVTGFHTEGGRTGISPPSLSSPPPEILKFSMVFGQDCVRSNLRRSKNQKISFGDMPPDPSRLLAC